MVFLILLWNVYWFTQNMRVAMSSALWFGCAYMPLAHPSMLSWVCQTAVKREWIPSNIDACHSPHAALLICISALACVTSPGRCTSTRVSIFKPAQMLPILKHTGTQREEQIAILHWQRCWDHQRSPLWTCPEGRLFATEALGYFPAASLQEENGLVSMSQCQFLAHNAPWEYIFHEPWMSLNLGRKRQGWDFFFFLAYILTTNQ